MNGVWKKPCPYLVHDFKFNVHLSRTQKNIMDLAKKVGFSEADLDNVEKL
jgi:hypothetical protein